MTGVVAPLDRVNVDTDQIIPKQFLKRIERTGFGQFAFFDWRFLPDGKPNPDFVLNKPGYQGASIPGGGAQLRVWFFAGARALGAAGLRLPLRHRPQFRRHLLQQLLSERYPAGRAAGRGGRADHSQGPGHPGYTLNVDLESQRVSDEGQEVAASFEIEPFRRHCLLNGLDDIGLTLEHGDKIAAFEARSDPYGGGLT